MTNAKNELIVQDGRIRFFLPDSDSRFTAASLYQEVLGERRLLDMDRRDGGFELWLDRPAVHRMEYAFDVTHQDGTTTRELDFANDMTVEGVFGRKSVIEFGGYQPPQWLGQSTDPVEPAEFAVESDRLAMSVPVRLWSAPGALADQSLPLLVVHDGYEFETYSSITRWAAAVIAQGWVRPFRLALLHPVERIAWYSANPAYAEALVGEVLPAITETVPVDGRPALTGASLGALAALHAHLTHQGVFAALFMQSGSFFTEAPPGREESLQAIPPFVSGLFGAASLADPVPAVVTAGVIERNFENARRVAATLAAHGYAARFVRVPDGHNYTAWRDALDPHLTELLARLWGGTGQRRSFSL
jgi:enterochelin esterase family protein